METMVVIGCPGCGRQYRYDSSRFGRTGIRIRCRSCETIMRVDIPHSLLAAVPGPAPDAPQPPATDAPAPAPPPAAAQLPATADATAAPRATPFPVAVLAEPDEGLRETLRGVLRQLGYQVHAVANGIEARGVIASRRPQLAVLNAFLPGILGVSLCAQVKHHPQLAAMRVVLTGTQYRRERFARDPHEIYGADGFLDGTGTPEEVRVRATDLLSCLPVDAGRRRQERGRTREDLIRLARIVVGDIILYNPQTAEREIATGSFLDAFASEIREGEALVEDRFQHIEDRNELFHRTLREALAQHREECGIAGVAGIPV
jgi:CheY-like chemotaxis protein